MAAGLPRFPVPDPVKPVSGAPRRPAPPTAVTPAPEPGSIGSLSMSGAPQRLSVRRRFRVTLPAYSRCGHVASPARPAGAPPSRTSADPPPLQSGAGAASRTAGWPSTKIPGTVSNMPAGHPATSDSRSIGRPLMKTDAAPVCAHPGSDWALAGPSGRLASAQAMALASTRRRACDERGSGETKVRAPDRAVLRRMIIALLYCLRGP